MKRFTKICLITSLILILVGSSICAIGAFAGGWRLVNSMGNKGPWWNVVDRVAYAYNWNHIYDDDDWNNWIEWDSWEEKDIEITRDGKFYQHHVAGKDYTETGISQADVSEIQIDIGGAALYIYESEHDTFGIKKDGAGKYECYVSDGRIYVEGNKKNYVRTNNETVYLYIPKDMKFNNMEINIGAGLLEAGTLSADEMDIAVGAGSIRVENITSRDLSVETGAGKVTLNGVNADEMDLDVGVGHAYVEGNVTQELDVECGMGSAQLKLNGEERDFNYDIECAAGSIHVGTQTYSALASDKYVNNSALKECSLKCSMGSIQVSFTK